MRAEDVTDTIELALAASGCDQAVARHTPCLLSDNGSSDISGYLAEWLEAQKMKHIRGAEGTPFTHRHVVSVARNFLIQNKRMVAIVVNLKPYIYKGV